MNFFLIKFTFKVFDFWGKIASGYFEGNQFNFGHFTPCLKFRHEIPVVIEKVQGKYCLVAFTALPNSTLVNGELLDGLDWREA